VSAGAEREVYRTELRVGVGEPEGLYLGGALPMILSLLCVGEEEGGEGEEERAGEVGVLEREGEEGGDVGVEVDEGVERLVAGKGGEEKVLGCKPMSATFG
jgi:hypothetical protein